MSETTARISEIVVTLNSIMAKIDDNDTVEFDIDHRLSVLEAQADTLSNEVEEALEFSEETST